MRSSASMKIKLKGSFVSRLSRQVDYIAYDSPIRARKFQKDIIKAIKSILPNPYKHRQSIYFEDTNIRDLIFKGYTIVFRIVEKDNIIEVFGFVKYQEKAED